VLLSVLEERLLVLPSEQLGEGYLKVHPKFSAIFTSNPEEYAGVHKTQDALLDRMITLKLDHPDAETEIAITQAKSGLPQKQAQAIVEMIREFRTIGVNNALPTIRASIMIARIVASRGEVVDASDPMFRKICHDVVNIDYVKVKHDGKALGLDRLNEIIDKYCSVAAKPDLVSASVADNQNQGQSQKKQRTRRTRAPIT